VVQYATRQRLVVAGHHLKVRVLLQDNTLEIQRNLRVSFTGIISCGFSDKEIALIRKGSSECARKSPLW